MADTIPNQANYKDDQNFEIDINKVFNDFIMAIDKVRSYTNVSTITNQSAISVFSSGDSTLAKLKSQVTTEATPQESRCHAFFRIIGFPVVSSAFKMYNPGHDIVFNPDRKIGPRVSAAKLSIAASPIDKFRDLSIEREKYVSKTLDIFSHPTSIDAGTLALSSGANIRQFAVPFIVNSEPFDMDPKSQQYVIDVNSTVGAISQPLTLYIDVIGQTPSKATPLLAQRTHIIKPFMVDPVIDFTVNDATKLISVPFVPSKAELFVKDGPGGYVNRPIIEQVIRDRFTVGNQEETTGTADQSVIDYIKSIPAIQDEEIINQVSSGDVYKLGEQTQFVKYINMIRAMMASLVEAQLAIRDAQSKYYWVPVPASNGPEGGCTVQGVFLSDKVTSDFITPRDRDIIQSKVKVTINQINAQTASTEGVPDVGGFAFDSFKTTFGPDTTTAMGDSSAQSLQELTDKRSADLKKASDALRTIEIIMGEFSGLGLCDIIAVMGSLYIMPKDSLLGFLDDDALDRMNIALSLNESSPGIESAMGDFSSTVKDFYNLMDKIYQDLSQNNGLQ
jgi:hypothetical protein